MKNIHLTEIKHSWENVKYTPVNECAKFRGWRGAIRCLVGLVPSCHCAFVAISWIQFFFLVGISWVQNFLVGIRGSEIFSCGYFVGQNFFLVSILWTQFFPYHWFRASENLGCWLYEPEWQKQKYQNSSQTTDSFLNWFQQLQTVYIRKVLYPLSYLRYYTVLICGNCSFRYLLSSLLGSFHS